MTLSDRSIRNKFNADMNAARRDYAEGMYDTAFKFLEHAHILGQRYFFMHLLSHWWMLKVGFKRTDKREIFGQVMRMIAVLPGFIFGWVPKGNTGGANVSPVKPMPLPSDLEALLGGFNVWHDVRIRFVIIGVLIISILGLKAI